uniref:Mos1 transposase HTH domain-containing protein n=1 Tax=Panagrolaimus superbus TaxID=310955 RepID=A0A914YPT5_9BILA
MFIKVCYVENFNGKTKQVENSTNLTKKRDQVLTDNSSVNGSTLSLHISAYENAADSTSELKVSDDKQSLFKDSFEFPRGRVRETTEPEIMQFRASQKLLNPNKGHVSKPARLDASSPGAKQHLRHLMLGFYNQNPQITGKEMVKKIEEIYGRGVISEQTCRKWKKRFENGEKDVSNLDDNDRSGRPEEVDEQQLREAVMEDHNATIRILADRLGNSYGAIQRHLHKMGMLGKWVPHQLSPDNMLNRLRIATDLLNRHRQGNLPLDRIVTGDEKWIMYENVVRRGQWVARGTTADPVPKRELHPKKCMLSLFWDSEGT